MAAKGDRDAVPKRLNRAVGVSEALSGVLGTMLRKRGFATRDLLARWPDIAPRPYDTLAVPAELKWPRGAGHEGAVLYVRCTEGQRLALAHQAPLIAAAVNRYFGYFLVREVKLHPEPMKRPAPPATRPAPPPPEAVQHAESAVTGVDDTKLRDALKSLGEQVLSRRPR